MLLLCARVASQDADARWHKRRSRVDPRSTGRNKLTGLPALHHDTNVFRGFDHRFSKIAAHAGTAAAAPSSTASPHAPVHVAVTWSTPKQLCVRFELGGLLSRASSASTPSFTVRFSRDWAPQGVTHIMRLVGQKFFDGSRFFRVVPGFVAQFGVSGADDLERRWAKWRIGDDPRKPGVHNVVGTVAFAAPLAARSAGQSADDRKAKRNSRTTQLFINLGDNSDQLDAMHFVPVGKVVSGLQLLQDSLQPQADHGGPRVGKLVRGGNKYLQSRWPKLSYVKLARVVGCPRT
eukprot:g400.t1